ncbi:MULTISPECIES: hydantoinase B/oxoprolinase family protein [Streptomyces]|uniref:N-methylhydantoinase B n=2 Tax=Streptomyces TaxID=1883 RepID=A0ABT9KW40_9ACTN|nr:hydantoinase B/oxoprolinase family protein [Streptomyces demainii]MDP9612574.1 N-methylhydantoinase B [Streptomyces demainii]
MNATAKNTTAPDPVLVEVMGSALSSIVEEMGETLVRAAYSSNIKERRDCTAGLFDAEGRMLAQAEQASPVHLGSLIGVVSAVLERFPRQEIRPGDTFLSNDPYSGGGSHLPDMVLVTPVFVDGLLTAWAANLAHHADFGDRGHAHIFQEGLRIPPVRFARDGSIQEDVFRLILTNCQVPAERRADFRAQLAANRLATSRYTELAGRYGRATMTATAAALLDYTERRTRAAIAEVPDGTYTFRDSFDCPELDDELQLRLKVTVAGDELHFDFAGNPGQVRASVNMVWTALYATVYYAVKTLVDPDIPSNAGLHRPIRIDAPPGSIVNCVEPAAVNGRTETCQRVVDLVHGALASAVPERVTAAANGANTGVHFSGLDSGTGKYFVYLETIGGGSGARAAKDGLDGVQVHVTNTSNLPVESLESEYPLVVEAYELVEDSGGAGRHRGGMGIRRTIRVEESDVQFWLDTSRQTSRPWGLFGGRPGSSASVELSDGARPVVHGHTVLQPGDRVSIVTAGAGGYGDPAERSPQEVRRDIREQVISPERAREHYGAADGDA